MEKITSKRAPKFLLKTKKVIKNLEFRKSPKLIFGEVFNIVSTIDYFLLLLRQGCSIGRSNKNTGLTTTDETVKTTGNS